MKFADAIYRGHDLLSARGKTVTAYMNRDADLSGHREFVGLLALSDANTGIFVDSTFMPLRWGIDLKGTTKRWLNGRTVMILVDDGGSVRFVFTVGDQYAWKPMDQATYERWCRTNPYFRRRYGPGDAATTAE